MRIYYGFFPKRIKWRLKTGFSLISGKLIYYFQNKNVIFLCLIEPNISKNDLEQLFFVFIRNIQIFVVLFFRSGLNSLFASVLTFDLISRLYTFKRSPYFEVKVLVIMWYAGSRDNCVGHSRSKCLPILCIFN